MVHFGCGAPNVQQRVAKSHVCLGGVVPTTTTTSDNPLQTHVRFSHTLLYVWCPTPKMYHIWRTFMVWTTSRICAKISWLCGVYAMWRTPRYLGALYYHLWYSASLPTVRLSHIPLYLWCAVALSHSYVYRTIYVVNTVYDSICSTYSIYITHSTYSTCKGKHIYSIYSMNNIQCI